MNPYLWLLLRLALSPILGNCSSTNNDSVQIADTEIADDHVQTFHSVETASASDCMTKTPALEPEANLVESQPERAEQVKPKRLTNFQDLPTDVLRNLAELFPKTVAPLIDAVPEVKSEIVDSGIYNYALAETFQIPELAQIPYHNDLHALDGVIFPSNEAGKKEALKHLLMTYLFQMQNSSVQEHLTELIWTELLKQDWSFFSDLAEKMQLKPENRISDVYKQLSPAENMSLVQKDFFNKKFLQLLRERQFEFIRDSGVMELFGPLGSLGSAVETLSIKELSEIITDCHENFPPLVQAFFSNSSEPLPRVVAATFMLDSCADIIRKLCRVRANASVFRGIEYAMESEKYVVSEEEGRQVYERILSVFPNYQQDWTERKKGIFKAILEVRFIGRADCNESYVVKALLASRQYERLVTLIRDSFLGTARYHQYFNNSKEFQSFFVNNHTSLYKQYYGFPNLRNPEDWFDQSLVFAFYGVSSNAELFTKIKFNETSVTPNLIRYVLKYGSFDELQQCSQMPYAKFSLADLWTLLKFRKNDQEEFVQMAKLVIQKSCSRSSMDPKLLLELIEYPEIMHELSQCRELGMISVEFLPILNNKESFERLLGFRDVVESLFKQYDTPIFGNLTEMQRFAKFEFVCSEYMDSYPKMKFESIYKYELFFRYHLTYTTESDFESQMSMFGNQIDETLDRMLKKGVSFSPARYKSIRLTSVWKNWIKKNLQ